MSAFDKVIGYENIKRELMMACDMIHHRDKYEKLGAKLPHGVILCGIPGVGKTLMATCFLEECKLPSYILRRNTHDENFLKEIEDVFAEATKNAPSVVLLDDLDKFANEDPDFGDSAAFVTVQDAMDKATAKGVFVIATAYILKHIPESLKRTGRFDRRLNISEPSEEDAEKIIEYYLSDKQVSDSVNIKDINKMMTFSSCSNLETLLNYAAIEAAYRGKEKIETEDFLSAVLKIDHNLDDKDFEMSEKDLREVAMHEAGHLVVAEMVNAESVGLVSVGKNGDDPNGINHMCKKIERRPHAVLISLAGKAAVEMYFNDRPASGCIEDLHKAHRYIFKGISDNATHGLNLICSFSPESPDSLKERGIAVVNAELERYMRIAKDILIKNREFLEKIAKALEEKHTLMFSEIQQIKKSVKTYEYTI